MIKEIVFMLIVITTDGPGSYKSEMIQRGPFKTKAECVQYYANIPFRLGDVKRWYCHTTSHPDFVRRLK